MKVVMKQIQVIAVFTENARPAPVKFKLLKEDGTYIVVKINKIITINEERLAGNRMFVYACQSIFDGVEKRYELKYEINTCKWYLYKI